MPKLITPEQLVEEGLVNATEKKINKLSLREQIKEFKRSPQQERDYLSYYLNLENHIITNNPDYSKETLRENIKSQFNTQWLSPALSALFNFKEPEKIILLYTIFKKILIELKSSLDKSSLQRTVSYLDILISDKDIDFSSAEKKLFSNERQLSNSLQEIKKVLGLLNQLAISKVGSSQTKHHFRIAFNQMKEKYAPLSYFTEVLKELPHGILEEEKYELLSREELQEVSRKLTRLEQMKSEFTNIAAHELGTPLVPILGYSEMLLKEKLPAHIKEKIEIIYQSALREKRLVDDILNISKLEAGEMKFEMEKTDLLPLLKSVVSGFIPEAKSKGLNLKSELPITLPKVFADLNRLIQVTNNLCNNAIKFSEKGTITIKASVQRKNIRIEITDSGQGIKKENFKNIFSKFFQVEEVTTRKTKGTGLGLAICKEIIVAHHGKIWAESKGLGKGSTFIFTLPIK